MEAVKKEPGGREGASLVAVNVLERTNLEAFAKEQRRRRWIEREQNDGHRYSLLTHRLQNEAEKRPPRHAGCVHTVLTISCLDDLREKYERKEIK